MFRLRKVPAVITDQTTAAFEVDLKRVLAEFPAAATALDVLMCYRLMLGRRPEFLDIEKLRTRAAYNDITDLAFGFIRSEEFRNRWETTGRKVPEVPVMAQLERFKMWFYLGDRVVGWDAAVGLYEPELALAVESYVKPGMLCCDLGANIGYFSLLMASAHAQVYAFEPFPKNHAMLARNVSENHFGEQIKVFQAAVLDKSGPVRLFMDENESDYVAMFVSADGGSTSGFRHLEIEAVELDRVVPQDRKVSCIKMDIEGSEPLAVAGMRRILERDHPRIFFEFNTRAIREHADGDPGKFLETLQRNGYSIATLDGNTFSYSGGEHLENLVAM